MSRSRSIALVVCLAVGLTVAAPARAEDSAAREAGLGVAAAFSSLVYGPGKVLFAAGGALVSGMAWLWTGGDSEVAKPILTAAVRGDYVITPSHLTGNRTLEFIGREPADRYY